MLKVCSVGVFDLIDQFEHLLGCPANGASFRRFTLDGIATVLANIKWFLPYSLALFEHIEGCLKQTVVNLLNLFRHIKGVSGLFLTLSLSLFYERGIHTVSYTHLTLPTILRV